MTIDGETAVPLPLTRAALAQREGTDVSTPPVRIVHLGLGAFHRAHQAWYTAAVDDAGEWGIAAFTGRSAAVADELAAQDGLYTLIERSDDGDRVSVIPSIVEAVDGANLRRMVELIGSPTTAVVTLTITEAGYRLTSDGLPDLADPAVTADIAWLSRALAADELPDLDSDREAGPRTTLARLLLGLDARRRAGAGPIAVVPCDNLPDNGAFVKRGLAALATAVSAETAAWLATRCPSWRHRSTASRRGPPIATSARARSSPAGTTARRSSPNRSETGCSRVISRPAARLGSARARDSSTTSSRSSDASSGF